MHEKRRYVKSEAGSPAGYRGRVLGRTALAVLLPLVLAPAARAEVVGPAVDDAALAVDAQGNPNVAYLRDGALFVTSRGEAWTPAQAPIRAAGTTIDGLVARRDGVAVLLRGPRALTLVERAASGGWRVTVRRIAAGRSVGPAGLALARGVPVIAYSSAAGKKSYLFLLRRVGLRLRAEQITRLGFPGAPPTPSAVPVVMPGGSVRVVQVYGFGAIEWFRQRGKWVGQYLFASQLGGPLGPVAAASARGAVYAAWTQDYPSLGETQVWLAVHRGGESSDVVLPHALFAALAVPASGPEVAGNDFVPLPGGTAFAGLVAGPGQTVELDGRIEGYVALDDGTRELLLSLPTGLEFAAVAALLPVRVQLESAAAADAVTLRGRVDGAAGGDLELYRETATTRELVAQPALAADGSFAAADPSPRPGTTYRAVYREPTTGLRYAALLRSSCCASRRG